MSRWWPMAPFNSKASTACWRSCRLFLLRKLMHWWVSWGLWRKVMPTPSSTMPVAQQVPSRLLHCGAKSARRAPTWTPSTLSSWGSWRSLPSLLSLLWVGSMAGSSVGAGTEGLLLCDSSLHSGGCRWTQMVEHRSPGLVPPGGWSYFHGSLCFLGFLDKRHRRGCSPVCLLDGPNPVLQNLGFRTQDVRALERGRPHSTQHLRLKAEVF